MKTEEIKNEGGVLSLGELLNINKIILKLL